MASFDTAYQLTLKHEGYYTAQPNETYMGIDRRYHPTWSGWDRIDFHKRFTNMTQNLNLGYITGLHDAHRAYTKLHFWDKLKGDSIAHQDLANVLFDTYFATGKTEPIRILQRIAGTTADGIIGPLSISAINAMSADGVYQAIVAINEWRSDFYSSSSRADVYGDGWSTRVASYAPTPPATGIPTTAYTPPPAIQAANKYAKIYGVAKIAIPIVLLATAVGVYVHQSNTKLIATN